MKLRIALLLVFTLLGLLALGPTIPNTNAQTVTILHSFGDNLTNGIGPGGLIQGSDGNFYGVTALGGVTNMDEFGRTGYGIVFRISPGGSETNLHSFTGPPNEGYNPSAWLVQGSDGNFYGTTSNLYGTVFRISPNGSYTNLYIFTGSPNDGRYPVGGLVQGSDGNFYGTASGGGTSTNCPFGCGTVFRISPSGNYTNLYSFIGSPTDGRDPTAGLMQGSDGNFYGTTAEGGSGTNCFIGCGTVFRISPTGNYTNLYSFVGSPSDGVYPITALVQGLDGNFYGTTPVGGINNNGIVFRIGPSGSETNLHSFDGVPDNGGDPICGLVLGSDGNFYGTAALGGTNGVGSIFRISPSGTYTDLYTFIGSRNNAKDPGFGLIQGSDGSFYGTAGGGTSTNCLQGCGTVFKLTIPLNPPPNQISALQVAGSNLTVSVPSVAYETYQLQFSSSMNPTNWVNVPGVSITNSIGALMTLTNFGGALQPQGFYRFDITP